ncbi:hypothetical protein VTO42DRAFT_594 [Malbranchea cinnamomea]
MAQTVLVTGATGLLGRQVVDAFRRDTAWKVVGQGFTRASPPDILKADLQEEVEAVKLLEEVKPTVVVHCAANRFPDKCDQQPHLARKINVEATRALAQETASRGIFLIYISTDYVFPGRPGEAPYEADTQTEPPNIYGETKRDGERVVLEVTRESGTGVVLRVPVLYGRVNSNSESAVNVLVDAVWKAQDPNAGVKMDDWSQRYPTNTEDVGRVCHDIAVKYLGAEDRKSLPKILQFTSEDRMTKYEICETIAEILGVPLPGMIRVKEGPKPGDVQRPYDTHLSTKALRDLGISVDTQDFKAWWRRDLGAVRH